MKRNEANGRLSLILLLNALWSSRGFHRERRQVARVSNRQLVDLFVRGESTKLAAFPLSDFERANSAELLVGTLVLRGEFERAVAIGSRLLAKDMAPGRVAVVAFYLSLGYSRAGRYKEAAAHIARIGPIGSSENLISFYRSQAQGFLDFVRGNFSAAVDVARNALGWAEVSDDPLQPLARILSLDLLGHSLIGTGSARRGIKSLKQARDVAVRLGHENFRDAISISILKYEALFGLDPTRIIARLTRALIELKPGDSYSRSELRLEIARQMVLRGRLKQARRHLEVAADDIVGSQNYLQTAALHLRMAWIARLEKRPDDALFSLLAAEKGLASEASFSEVHRDLHRKLLEFRNEVLRECGRVPEMNEIDSVAASWIERRMSARRSRRELTKMESRPTEDPFGDLMDRVVGRHEGIETELLKNEHFGLLLPMIDLNFSQTAVVLGAPEEAVIALAGGEAHVCRGGFGGILGKLLLRLSQGSCLKREAVESVWGYRYEPDRHDRLLAVAVSRIRKALGEGSAWLELQGDRLTLGEQVVIKVWPAPETRTKFPHRFGKTIEISSFSPPSSSNLNKSRLRVRQLQVLSELATRGDIGVRDVAQRFGVSRASALRDLNELVDLGYLLRLGETRATRYVLKEGLSI